MESLDQLYISIGAIFRHLGERDPEGLERTEGKTLF